jgi:hypothetical protein
MTELKLSANETADRLKDTAERGMSVLDVQVMYRLISHVQQRDVDVTAGDEPLQQLIRALLGSFDESGRVGGRRGADPGSRTRCSQA